MHRISPTSLLALLADQKDIIAACATCTSVLAAGGCESEQAQQNSDQQCGSGLVSSA